MVFVKSIQKNNFDTINIKTNIVEYINKEYEKINIPDKVIERLPQEDDFGNTEYKLKLVDPDEERVQHLVT